MNNPTLGQFIANLKQIGLPSTSYFAVEILGVRSQPVWMMCEATSLPGLTLMTSEARTYGEVRESPYGIIYPPIDLTILLDNTMDGKKLFEDWSNRVFNRKTKTQGYYNEFTSEIKIFALNRNNEPIYGVMLKECFPKNIGDIRMDYSHKDLMRLPVSITYRYWVELDKDGDEISRSTGKIDNFLDTPTDILIPDNRTPPSWTDYATGPMLQTAGIDLSSQLGVASVLTGQAWNSSSIGGTGMSGLFNSLSNGVSAFGGGMTSLGSNLTAVLGPVSSMGTAASSIASTLSSMDAALRPLGLGSPFSKISSELISISGKFGQVSGLNGVPSLIGAVGGNMSGTASAFSNLGTQLTNWPGSTKSLVTNLGNLGNMFSNQSNNLTLLSGKF